MELNHLLNISLLKTYYEKKMGYDELGWSQGVEDERR